MGGRSASPPRKPAASAEFAMERAHLRCSNETCASQMGFLCAGTVPLLTFLKAIFFYLIFAIEYLALQHWLRFRSIYRPCSVSVRCFRTSTAILNRTLTASLIE